VLWLLLLLLQKALLHVLSITDQTSTAPNGQLRP
jgi:hypothetical protein